MFSFLLQNLQVWLAEVSHQMMPLPARYRYQNFVVQSIPVQPEGRLAGEAGLSGFHTPRPHISTAGNIHSTSSLQTRPGSSV